MRSNLLISGAAALTLATGAGTLYAAVADRPADSATGTGATEYWTPQRMMSAKDVATVRSGQSPKMQSVAYAVAANPATVAPKPFNPVFGKIFFKLNGADVFCSGTAVESANKSTVWTAAHCMKGSKPNETITDVVFAPAYDNGQTPFGKWEMHSMSVSGAYANNPVDAEGYYDKRYDYAAFAVKRNAAGQRMLETFNGLPIAFDKTVGQPVTVHGYWSEKGGNEDYVCSSAVRDNTSNAVVDCGGVGGRSGGGWIATIGGVATLVGNTQGANSDITSGPKLGNDARAVYDAVQHINT
ncbi:hypothetical protein ABT117_31200 [Streptomyces sp. NPDC002262]|uniref:trypsin-like serine peptidase n=1 Tax=Streptomyces sp. NPDC002262 TaxID=3154414 RepID=UPI0033226A4F